MPDSQLFIFYTFSSINKKVLNYATRCGGSLQKKSPAP